MPHDSVQVDRRGLLRFVMMASAATILWRPAGAETATDAGASAPVQRLDTALLAAMKAGRSTPFSQRFAALAPVVEQTIDLNAVLAASVGLGWPAVPSDQKAQLLASFRRYTVASYAANFDSYSGETFRIAPGVRSVGNGDVIVQTAIVSTDGSTTRLDYVMRKDASSWQAIDVLTNGSISRVAVQRSDFRHLLANGGASALMAGLQNKVATLSGGMLS